jgi:carbamoyltransferase
LPVSLTAGLAGRSRHGCVALSDGRRIVGVCEQERATRVRGAGFNPTGLPDEALDLLLQHGGYTRRDVRRCVTPDDGAACVAGGEAAQVDHHLAHAWSAFLSSPFESATIVVCDDQVPKVSVWRGDGGTVTALDFAWEGVGFTDVYARGAALLGFDGPAGQQWLAALARLYHGHSDERIASLLRFDGTRVHVEPGWEQTIQEQVRAERTEPHPGSRAAAALQTRLSELFVELLRHVSRTTGRTALCLGGSLFYHSAINTAAKQADLFAPVFVPVDPGDPGLAVGAALGAAQSAPAELSPFLGPAYPAEEITRTLQNCKLHYSWESQESGVGLAVEALKRGHLVGWFDGAMEWGPRALGARCILASPLSPFVLENLNRFLKRRPAWRGYALSGLESAVHEHFSGPDRAPFMECDYVPRDGHAFAAALPASTAAVRLQTVGAKAPARFRRLLEAFGAATGFPFLVNTSFNGFHEPIVCSPRDAVRVFYGSGLDLLVLGEFVVAK